MEFALRLDGPKDNLLKTIIPAIQEYLKPDKFLYTFEISKKEKKPHSHAYIKIERDIKTDTISKWIRAQPWYKGKGTTSFVKVKDAKKYKDYICKDMNIIASNLSEEEEDELISRAQDIAFEKTLSKVDKLFLRVQNKYNPFSDDNAKDISNDLIIDEIVEWHLETGTLFPNNQQMFSYVNTIRARLTEEGKNNVKKNYSFFINKYATL